MSRGPVHEKSFEFSLSIIALHSDLVTRRHFALSQQLLRCGTSIGANIEEAQAAQSRRDFLAKMSIASKEVRECHYWLRLIRDASIAPPETITPLLDQCIELIRLLTAIVRTTATRPSPTKN